MVQAGTERGRRERLKELAKAIRLKRIDDDMSKNYYDPRTCL